MTAITNKAPLDFSLQLEVWNYHYNEATNQFFKYVGMGMMVLNPDWNLLFIVRGKNNSLLIYNGKTIEETIEEIPFAESLVFAQCLDIITPLMLEKP